MKAIDTENNENENIFIVLEEKTPKHKMDDYFLVEEMIQSLDKELSIDGENHSLDMNTGFSLDYHISDLEYDSMYDEVLSRKLHYQTNMTIKHLQMMSDYYGFSKDWKKKNKNDLIDGLVSFETDAKNKSIVIQREKMWYFMNELKKDSFMKKYVLSYHFF